MNRKTLFRFITVFGLLFLLVAIFLAPPQQIQAQGPTAEGSITPLGNVGTAFSYQGRLTNASGPVSGACDFKFSLWTAASGGTQLASVLEKTNVPLAEGNFSVELDFGTGHFNQPATFGGDARWLMFGVRCPAGSGAYTVLSGRIALNPTPYALSLRPGARVMGDVGNNSVFTAGNTTSADFGTAIFAETSATQGTGLYARATSESLENTYGVYATTASRGGTAVYGESTYASSIIDNTAYGGYFKAGAAGDVGVHGESAWGQGGGIGGEFSSNARYGYGVWAEAKHTSGENVGVHGKSLSSSGRGGEFIAPNNVGLFARGDDAGPRDVTDVRLGGDWGVLGAVENTDSNVSIVSNKHVWIQLDNDNNDDVSTFEVFYPGYSSIFSIFEVDQAGNTYAAGTKSAVVATEDYGRRKVYSMESPEVWFEDFGSSQLKGGVAEVGLEAIFAQTVNLSDDYLVFLTPLGDCALYVAEKTPAQFIVKAQDGESCNISFDYRLVAKRLGYENLRLEEAK